MHTIVFVLHTDVCSGHFTGPQGIIQSPGYPGNYPNDANCTWTIELPPGVAKTISISRVEIVDSDNCAEDYLLVTIFLALNLKNTIF